MLTAKDLWKVKRKSATRQRERPRRSIKEALAVVQALILEAEPIRHSSGTRMIQVDIPVKDLRSYRNLLGLIKALEKIGYTATPHTAEGWPTEQGESPIYLEVLTFEK